MNGVDRWLLAVSASHRIRCEETDRLTVATLRALLGMQQTHDCRAIDKARSEDW